MRAITDLYASKFVQSATSICSEKRIGKLPGHYPFEREVGIADKANSFYKNADVIKWKRM